MKKSLLLAVLLTACAPKVTTTTTNSPVGATTPGTANPSTTPPRASNATGAASAKAAVEQFLTAVRAEDIQAMSVIFGTNRGPARDNMDRDELEKRLVILQCYFNHDRFRVTGELPGDQGHRVVQVEMTRDGVTRSPNFYLIPGPGSRWYIDNMEIAAVRDFCRKSG